MKDKSIETFDELKTALEEMAEYYHKSRRELEERLPDEPEEWDSEDSWLVGVTDGTIGAVGALYLAVFGSEEYNTLLRKMNGMDEDGEAVIS